MQKDSIVKLAVIGTVACAAVFALTNFQQPASASLFATDNEFTQYVAKYGKSYGTAEEFLFREAQFVAKRALFEKINAENGNTFTVGVNKFSDWTQEEYKKILGFKAPPVTHVSYKKFDTTNVTATIDWRAKGAVTGVKNQG